jgi:hypothetical protein
MYPFIPGELYEEEIYKADIPQVATIDRVIYLYHHFSSVKYIKTALYNECIFVLIR